MSRHRAGGGVPMFSFRYQEQDTVSGKAVTPAVCRSRDGSGVFASYCTAPVRQRQPFDHNVLMVRLTEERLGSYLAATRHDPRAAIRLYDWNVLASGALLEDIARLEVVFRNGADVALIDYQHKGTSKDNRAPKEWYGNHDLFTQRGVELINAARRRATRSGQPERHGKVIAELSFGFWRFLCAKTYLTSLWVPALCGAFPHHPRAPDPRAVRADVHDRMKQLHESRNRIAHHEPIHRRDLAGDWEALVDVAGWMCPDSRGWIVANSRTMDILDRSPIPTIGRR